MAEIHELLRVTLRESGIQSVALVAVVRRRRGVAHRQRLDHRGVGDRARPDAVAHSDELAVPARLRHPDLEADVGVGSGSKSAGHATKRRQVGVVGRRAARSTPARAAWRLEYPGRDGLREGDLSVWQLEPGELSAVRSVDCLHIEERRRACKQRKSDRTKSHAEVPPDWGTRCAQ